MNLLIKGFIIGIGKIIPGVSGSLFAVQLNIYEPIIKSINNIWKKPLENIIFLGKIATGIIIAIFVMSKVIVNCLNHYYFVTMLLILGIIIGETIKNTKKLLIQKSDILILIIIMAFSLIIPDNHQIINHQINYTTLEFTKLILIGILDAITSIIPGLSGTAVLMSTGYYNVILKLFSNIINPNLFIAISFFLGFILGIFLISKILFKIYEKNKKIMDKIITITMFLTIITIIKMIYKNQIIKTYLDLIKGIILIIMGMSFSKIIKN